MADRAAWSMGWGSRGAATARLVQADIRFQHLVLADRDLKRADALAETLDGGQVTDLQMDFREDDQVAHSLAGVSVVLNTTGPFSRDTLSLMRTVIEAGIPYADINDDVETLQSVFESE